MMLTEHRGYGVDDKTATSIGEAMCVPAGQAMARTLSMIDVSAFDEAFMRSGYHVEKGGCVTEGKREKAEEFMDDMFNKKKHQLIQSPTILVYDMPDGSIACRFVDGRHRYFVLRDSGATRMCMATTETGQQIALDAGIATHYFVMVKQ
jgi:hypothetical protein